MLKATPILADINKTDFNIDLSSLESINNVKAVIIPHTFGVPANIDAFRKLKIPIIEDCAQSFGSKISNLYTGCFGDVSVFSFYASKYITTGQGGMVITANNDLFLKAIDYINFDTPKVYYPRFNLQLTDFQATIGIEQLKKVNVFIERRKQMAKEYIKIFDKKGIDFQKPVDVCMTPNYYRFVIKLNEKHVNCFIEKLKGNNIKCIVPIEKSHLLHNNLTSQQHRKLTFPVSELISISTISLPIYPDLLDEGNFERILDAIKKI
jgi:perosamine synthetase